MPGPTGAPTRSPNGIVKTMSRPLAALLGTAALACASLAQAQGGNAEAGQTKALPCMGCHAIESYNNVYPSYHVPRLGGQHEAYIVAALQAYKTGQRDHKTMVAQASSLSDQDMKDIAAYFVSISAK
jgi:cytochrome c553